MVILVAGVGNVLRRDDGFGVAVARTLASQPVPDGVLVEEVGIGGIHLVQQLLDHVDALVVVDTVSVDRPVGTVVVVRPAVRDVRSLPPLARRDELADMHWTTPDRVFLFAGALGVLPAETWVVGCRPGDTETLAEGLTEPVARAVAPAADEVRRLVTTLGVPWDADVR